MPNIDSARKRMKQNTVRRARNRSRRSRMRTQIREFRSLVEAAKLEEARAKLPSVFSVIDRSAQKGAIHSATAARYKSRLNRLLNGVSAD